MRREALPLGVASVGVASLLAGLGWDALRHARDPGLAHREDLLSLTNLSHLLIVAGAAAAALGVAAAVVLHLGATGRRRWAGVAGASGVLVVAGSIAAMAWAATNTDQAGSVARDVVPTAGAPVEDSHDVVPAASDVGDPGEFSPTSSTSLPPAGHSDHDPVGGGDGPTAEQQAAADRLVAETRAQLSRFGALADAEAEGYVAVTPPWLPIVHYVNPRYHADGVILDTERPESLVYGNTAAGPVLLGAMYLMPEVGEPGPEIGGPLTRWHAHHDLCFAPSGMIVAFVAPDGTCPGDAVNRPTPHMLHVWLIDHPEGPFSDDMDPDVLLAQFR